jgi:hypothetical protein
MKKLSISILLLLCLTGQTQTIQTENLEFENFNISIYKFISLCRPYSKNGSPKIDTLVIGENPCDQNGWYIGGTTLKVIPKFKNDSFLVSFAYEVSIWEVERYSKNKTSTNPEYFTYVTDYKIILPLAKNKFKIPDKWTVNGYTRSIKKKYNFHDTLITGTTEGGPFEYKFTKSGKVFGDNWNNLYIRIKRSNNGVVRENKFIMVGLEPGCD